MAGIGFELRKVVGRGGLGSFLGAAFSGIMIVAGPWLFSIVGIALIQRIISRLAGANLIFTATVIYSYAWSLVLFGGFHIIYTRIVADLLYEKKESLAAGVLIFFMSLIAATSLCISIPVYCINTVDLPLPWLYGFSSVLLFLAINIVWILMIFITLLRRYVLILLIYLGGIGLSVLLVAFLSPPLGLEGSLLGFAVGHLSIAISLAVLAFRAHQPSGVSRGWYYLRSYLTRFPLLALTGYLYNWAMWVDKIIFWFSHGIRIEGTIFRLFAAYDVAVYVANLSMIPGLVYFIVVSETSFYLQLRKFLLVLAKGTLTELQKRGQGLLSGMRTNFGRQALFQSIFTVSLLLMAPLVTRLFEPGQAVAFTIRIVLGGVYFHFLSLTVMNYHFYLEFYLHALLTAALFFSVNTGFSLLMVFGALRFFPGAGYLAGAVVSALYSYLAVAKTGRKVDRRILAKSSGL